MTEAIQAYYKQSEDICTQCGGRKINYGKTARGAQRKYCKTCRKSSLSEYQNKAWKSYVNPVLVSLLKEGCGIRSLSRLLGISVNTVLSRIKSIAKNIQQPILSLHREYQVDELCTYVQNKENRIWIASAWEKETKKIVRYAIGKRTNKTLKKVVGDLLVSQPERISTDKLRNYVSLIPSKIHSTRSKAIQNLERMHLTLRTHLKRLNRRTIAFSKDIFMLNAQLKIYLWN